MSEIWKPSPEELETSKSIRRLTSDFKFVSNNYADVVMSMQKYIQSEYEVDEAKADEFIDNLVLQNELPTSKEFEKDPELAMNQFRYSMYTVAVPLYEASHSLEETESWLPYAYNVSIGSHKVDDECVADRRCPAKLIAGSLQNRMIIPDFNSVDYKINPEKTALLLDYHREAGIKCGLLGVVEAGAMEKQFYDKYTKRFGNG